MIQDLKQTTSSTEAAEAKFERRLELVMASFDRHQLHLLSYIFSLTKNWHDAEDVLQSLWQHVLQHFPEEKIGNLAILRRKAWQVFVDAHRYRKRRNEDFRPSYEGIDPESDAYQPLTEAEEAAFEKQFWDELPGLEINNLQKTCLWRHVRFEYSYSEIAAQLDIGKSTVGDAVTAARAAIINYLEQQNQ